MEWLQGDKGLIIETVYGGTDLERQAKKLNAGVDIIVGTPGRVIDMTKRGHLELSNIEIFCLDEQIECWIWAFSRCHVDNFTSTKPKTDPSFQCDVPSRSLGCFRGTPQ